MSSVRRGFTLIELLVVIAIVAVLAVTVILTLNPAQLLKQARDSTRISDMRAIASAIAMYQAEGAGSIGVSSTVYVALADSSATCANHTLPALPAGWTYACSGSATYRNTNGTGWMPLNLSAISAGSPLALLPVDPVSTDESGQYYTYVVGSDGTFAFGSLLESQKSILATAARDGGVDYARYELGSNIELAGIATGLVGYWRLEETSGTVAANDAGTGVDATWAGTTAPGTAGKIGNAAQLDGIDDALTLNSVPVQNSPTVFTIAAWVNPADDVGAFVTNNCCGGDMFTRFVSTNRIYTNYRQTGVGSGSLSSLTGSVLPGIWTHVVIEYANNSVKIYINGELNVEVTSAYTFDSVASTWILGRRLSSLWHAGLVDELRIYNRILSPVEVAAMYAGTY